MKKAYKSISIKGTVKPAVDFKKTDAGYKLFEKRSILLAAPLKTARAADLRLWL